jgi:hypothetical protein
MASRQFQASVLASLCAPLSPVRVSLRNRRFGSRTFGPCPPRRRLRHPPTAGAAPAPRGHSSRPTDPLEVRVSQRRLETLLAYRAGLADLPQAPVVGLRGPDEQPRPRQRPRCARPVGRGSLRGPAGPRRPASSASGETPRASVPKVRRACDGAAWFRLGPPLQSPPPQCQMMRTTTTVFANDGLWRGGRFNPTYWAGPRVTDVAVTSPKSGH